MGVRACVDVCVVVCVWVWLLSKKEKPKKAGGFPPQFFFKKNQKKIDYCIKIIYVQGKKDDRGTFDIDSVCYWRDLLDLPRDDS